MPSNVVPFRKPPEGFFRQGDEADDHNEPVDVPPYDDEAERSVLSCVLVDAENALPKIDLHPQDFFSRRHSLIYSAVLEIPAPDVVTVSAHLKSHDLLSQVGGIAYVTELLNVAPSIANVTKYAEIVSELSKQRQILAACQRTVAQIYAKRIDSKTAVERVTSFSTIRSGFKLQKLDDILEPSIDRAKRRKSGEERPVPLPWKSLLAHFGGGLWPGVHFLCAGTGIGKTTLGLQIAAFAAFAGLPTGYIGLELEHFQFAMRMMGELAGVGWSHAYTGRSSDADISRMASTIPSLKSIPFYLEVGRPQAWPVSELGRMGQSIRDKHPEKFPGSNPFLLVVDFLQLVGDETNTRPSELRERIGRAAYYARDVAARLNAAVLVISSIARDKYDVLQKGAGIKFNCDSGGRPIDRRILNPDAIVGIGKESGDIEFSGDSVSAIFRAPNPLPSGQGEPMLFVTPKGRATGANWSPMYFTGFRYEEPQDGGRAIALGLQGAEKASQAARAEKAKGKDERKLDDVLAVVKYVLANPGCGLGEARKAAGDAPARWDAVVEELGSALTGLSSKKGKKAELSIDPDRLSPELKRILGDTLEVPRYPTETLGLERKKPRRGSFQTQSLQGSKGATLETFQGWTTAADVSVLVDVRQRGEDPGAWATEEGWDPDRIRAAISAMEDDDDDG